MLAAIAAVLLVSLAAAAPGPGVTRGTGDASSSSNAATPGAGDAAPAQDPQAPLTPNLVLPGTNATVPGTPGSPEFTSPERRAEERQTLRSIRDAVRQGAQPGVNTAGPSTMGGVQGLRVFRVGSGFVLTGTVHSEEEKDAAEERAAAVSGGVPIINQIIVR